MYKNYKSLKNYLLGLAIAAVGFYSFSCTNDESAPTSYVDSRLMSNIQVEAGTLKPQITWAGGFANVVGANKGNDAKLDTSLIWLIKSNNESIRYPLTFGTVPSGGESLLAQFGGQQLESLQEDFTYTYWIVKGNIWDQISLQKNKIFIPDESLPEGQIKVEGDTVKISQQSFTIANRPIDLYPNIKDVQLFGRLGKISITQATDANGPVIKWEITQKNVTETKLSAMGIVMGQRYAATNMIWEMWSVEDGPEGKIYGKQDIISAPIYAGAIVNGTKVFQEFPEEGLVRNKDYYIWIANSMWDGKSHGRTVNGYAYAYFKTW